MNTLTKKAPSPGQRTRRFSASGTSQTINPILNPAALGVNNPVDVLRRYIRKPEGRFIRATGDRLFVVPPYAADLGDRDLQGLYLELSTAGSAPWARRVCSGKGSLADLTTAAEWLMWTRAPEGWPYD
ncbi:hypothetical protein [Marispirochaeta aestuarii]|uniref:hypothetical protein n=1 Tax=Marispirochaeta aestuarii TaxID=1963862 RepID=UPI0029C8B431|nr:hypothetical protein [Marispirochaeta aestuarii]